MADWSFPSLTTVKVGFVTTTVQIGNNIISVNPGISYKDNTNFVFTNISPQVPGFLTGRRLGVGQLYPRGVYNK
jgi:hypothetical protein|tara:strand:+ start:2833 stop:3054 length:222 start_codon:yes stop_codon:yes gene_type:complete